MLGWVLVILKLITVVKAATPSAGACLCVHATHVNVRDKGRYNSRAWVTNVIHTVWTIKWDSNYDKTNCMSVHRDIKCRCVRALRTFRGKRQKALDEISLVRPQQRIIAFKPQPCDQHSIRLFRLINKSLLNMQVVDCIHKIQVDLNFVLKTYFYIIMKYPPHRFLAASLSGHVVAQVSNGQCGVYAGYEHVADGYTWYKFTTLHEHQVWLYSMNLQSEFFYIDNLILCLDTSSWVKMLLVTRPTPIFPVTLDFFY